MKIISHTLIKLSSKFVGEDEFGNRYYEKKRVGPNGRQKRFVIYNGVVEANTAACWWL